MTERGGQRACIGVCASSRRIKRLTVCMHVVCGGVQPCAAVVLLRATSPRRAGEHVSVWCRPRLLCHRRARLRSRACCAVCYLCRECCRVCAVCSRSVEVQRLVQAGVQRANARALSRAQVVRDPTAVASCCHVCVSSRRHRSPRILRHTGPSARHHGRCRSLSFCRWTCPWHAATSHRRSR